MDIEKIGLKIRILTVSGQYFYLTNCVNLNAPWGDPLSMPTAEMGNCEMGKWEEREGCLCGWALYECTLYMH